MKKLHLMHQKNPSSWYILDVEKANVGVSQNGIVQRLHCEDLMQADGYWELLQQIYDSGNYQFYGSFDGLYSNGETICEVYPQHWSLFPIPGMVRKCYEGFRKRETYTRGIVIDYIGQLWIRENEDTFKRVQGFDLWREALKVDVDELGVTEE